MAMYYTWMSRVRWMTPIFKDWGFFSFGYFAIVMEQILGLGLIIQTLSAIAFSEWAVVSALMTLVGALSQLGLKTAYMQLVADQITRSRQYQALRATFIFLGITGFLGGSLISIVLAVCATWGIWENTELLWVLPWVLMCTNLQMVLVTELRLSDRVRSFVILSYQRSLVFVLAIGCLSQIFKNGLHLIYWAQLVAGVPQR